MKILLDMNLSPSWVPVLQREGFQAVHWSTVGQSGARDEDILGWAARNGFVVVTHDLDFGAILAACGPVATGPSVVQIRAQDITPQGSRELLLDTLRQFRVQLEEGALISVDTTRSRIRVLPLS